MIYYLCELMLVLMLIMLRMLIIILGGPATCFQNAPNPRWQPHAYGGWHCLSTAPCLLRPRLSSEFFAVSRITVICYMIRYPRRGCMQNLSMDLCTDVRNMTQDTGMVKIHFEEFPTFETGCNRALLPAPPGSCPASARWALAWPGIIMIIIMIIISSSSSSSSTSN